MKKQNNQIEWKEVGLKELIECVENGNRPKGGVGGLKEGIPSIGGEHINKKGGFNLSNIKFISEEFYNIQRRGIIQQGDVLVVKDGATTGRVTFVSKDNFPYKKALVNEHVFILRPKYSMISSKFLFYCLYGEVGQEKILDNFHGSAQGGINTQFVKNVILSIPFSNGKPDLEEQERIVGVLEKVDKQKERGKKIEDLLNEYLKSVFNEMFIQPIKNTSWDFEVVDKICNLVRGSSPRPQGDPRYYGGKVPRLMVSDITRDGKYTTPKIDFLTEEGAKLSRPMKKGEVIMAVSGNPGLPTILTVDACIHDGFVGFRDLDKRVKPEYLYYYLLVYKELHKSQSVGSIFKNLNTDQIKKYKIILPPILLQNKFVKIAELVDKLKENAKRTNQNSEALFNSFTTKSFRGEL